MINIIETKSVPDKGADLSSPYVARLKQLARSMENGAASRPAANGNGVDTMPSTEQASDTGGNGQPAVSEPANHKDFSARGLAEQVVPKFVEALSSVFEEVQQITADNRRNVQSAMLYTAKLSARMENLANEFASVRQRVDPVVVADREQDAHLARLNERLGGYERLLLTLQEQVRQLEQRGDTQQGLLRDRLTEVAAGVSQIGERLDVFDRSATEAGASWSKTQDGQQALEARQTRQAEAIRALHEMLAAQSEQQEQLRATLQRLCEVTASHAALRPLPENL